MSATDDAKREFAISEMENWNMDRTVDPPVKLRGLMGKDAGGTWRYISVDSTGKIIISGGGGTPGGLNTDVQYNDGGVFGGDANFTWDKTTFKLTNAKGDIECILGGFSTKTGYVVGTSGAGEIILPTSAPFGIAFKTNNTEKFRMGNSGELGIGGANYGNVGDVLTSGGALAPVTWAPGGGGSPHALLDGTQNNDTVAHTPVLGDMIYGNVTPAWQALAGNTTTTKMYLSQTGTGAVSAVPAWAQIAYADISGTPTIPTGANPTATIGLTVINGAAATFMRSDAAPPLSQAIVPSWTGLHTFLQAGIATTYTNVVELANTTASTAGVPVQQSPSEVFTGHGWKTGIGAADYATKFRVTDVPISGAVIAAKLTWAASVQTGADSYVEAMTLSDVGALDVKLQYNVNGSQIAASNLSNGTTGSGSIVLATAPTFATSITTPSVLATANDSGALGASGTAFADLFLASGGVINWAAGNATLTHATGALSFNAVSVLVPVMTATTISGASKTYSSTEYGKTVFRTHSGAMTDTLPATGVAAGSWFRVINMANQSITFTAPVADTLVTVNDSAADSVAFSTISQKIGACVLFVSDGSNWVAMNQSVGITMTVAT